MENYCQLYGSQGKVMERIIRRQKYYRRSEIKRIEKKERERRGCLWPNYEIGQKTKISNMMQTFKTMHGLHSTHTASRTGNSQQQKGKD